MAKSDAKKRAEMMAKEWKKSKSTMKSINELVEMGNDWRKLPRSQSW